MESSRIESAGLYMLGEGAGEVTVKSRRWTITTRAGAADVREASLLALLESVQESERKKL